MSAIPSDPLPPEAAGEDAALADELPRRLMAFVRAFGLHQPDATPCGAPVPVSEAHALAALADGDLPQSELARRLRLGKSTVSRLVDQLERRGWAHRGPGGSDGRRRTVALTAQGRVAAADIARRRADRLARLLDRIPPDERPAVLRALTTLVEAARD